MTKGYIYEPVPMEIFIAGLVGKTLGRPYYRQVARWLGASASDRILDYCSGGGSISGEILKGLPHGQLVYCDVSEKWLCEAGKRLKRFGNAKGEKLDSFQGEISGGGYDRILVHFALHDFPAEYRSQIINQLIDNMKPSGRLYIREPLATGHGISLHELINMLEYTKKLSYDYKIIKSRFVGIYVEIETQLLSSR